MLEAILISVITILAVACYVFRTQRDHARRDAEQKKREADKARLEAKESQEQTDYLIRVSEERARFGLTGDGLNGQLRRDYDRR